MLLLCGFNTGASSRAASTLSLDIFLQVLERATGIEPVKPQLGRFCKIADLVKGHCYTHIYFPKGKSILTLSERLCFQPSVETYQILASSPKYS